MQVLSSLPAQKERICYEAEQNRECKNACTERGAGNGTTKRLKQSEEWEDVRMNILEIGMAKGRELGLEEGRLETLIENIESTMKNFNIDLPQACEGLGTTVEEYEMAKQKIASWKQKNTV